MAEHLVSALTDHLTSFVIEKISEEISLVSRHREDLEFICNELQSMKCFLKDAGGVWRTNSSLVRNWLQKVEDFIYDTMHILEDSTHAQCHNTLMSSYLLGRKIRVLKERIRSIQGSSNYLKYYKKMDVKPLARFLSGESIRNRRKSTELLLEATTVGLENDIHRISKWVLTDGPPIIAVAGMGGLGKTFLLRHVFHSQEITEHFDHLVWVEVFQSFSVRQLLLHIAIEIKLPEEEKESNLDVHALIDNIRKHLQGRRCLFVLDDVWDNHAVSSLRLPLEGRSKAMISTRDRKVLEYLAPYHIHHLDYLSEDNSWKLFCIHAFAEDPDHSPPKELETMARAIERKCSRLPLAVKTVAASMANVNPLPND